MRNARTYVNAYMHTYIHTYLHTHIHSCLHTYVRTTFTHTDIHTFTYTCINTYIHVHLTLIKILECKILELQAKPTASASCVHGFTGGSGGKGRAGTKDWVLRVHSRKVSLSEIVVMELLISLPSSFLTAASLSRARSLSDSLSSMYALARARAHTYTCAQPTSPDGDWWLNHVSWQPSPTGTRYCSHSLLHVCRRERERERERE